MFDKFRRYMTSLYYQFFGSMGKAEEAFHSAPADTIGGGTVIESKKNQSTLLQALLRGEVTDEVEKLRYEMYEVEKESHKYEYLSNSGRGVRKSYDNTAEFNRLNNQVEGERLIVLQEVREDVGTLDECMKYDGFVGKAYREFNVKVDRDIVPRFRIEEFSNQVAIMRNGEETFVDFYVSVYPSQFNRRHQPFLNAVREIYDGYRHSDILDIKAMSFVTYKASGDDDRKLYAMSGLKYDMTGMSNGNYIIRFKGNLDKCGKDITDEFKKEWIKEKFDNKEPREGATVDFTIAKNKYDFENSEEARKADEVLDYIEKELS